MKNMLQHQKTTFDEITKMNAHNLRIYRVLMLYSDTKTKHNKYLSIVLQQKEQFFM